MAGGSDTIQDSIDQVLSESPKTPSEKAKVRRENRRKRRKDRRAARQEAARPKEQQLFNTGEQIQFENQKNQQLRFANQAQSTGLLGQGQARGDVNAAIASLNQFAEQGPGPSLAQAQLLQAQDQNIAAAQSLAAGARGTGGQAAALRQAQQQAAVTGQATAQSAGILRAQEDAAFQQQKLAAIQAAGGLAGGLRGQDIGLLQGGAGAALGQQQLGVDVAGQQLSANLEIELQRAKQEAARQAQNKSFAGILSGGGLDIIGQFGLGN